MPCLLLISTIDSHVSYVSHKISSPFTQNEDWQNVYKYVNISISTIQMSLNVAVLYSLLSMHKTLAINAQYAWPFYTDRPPSSFLLSVRNPNEGENCLESPHRLLLLDFWSKHKYKLGWQILFTGTFLAIFCSLPFSLVRYPCFLIKGIFYWIEYSQFQKFE